MEPVSNPSPFSSHASSDDDFESFSDSGEKTLEEIKQDFIPLVTKTRELATQIEQFKKLKNVTIDPLQSKLKSKSYNHTQRQKELALNEFAISHLKESQSHSQSPNDYDQDIVKYEEIIKSLKEKIQKYETFKKETENLISEHNKKIEALYNKSIPLLNSLETKIGAFKNHPEADHLCTQVKSTILESAKVCLSNLSKVIVTEAKDIKISDKLIKLIEYTGLNDLSSKKASRAPMPLPAPQVNTGYFSSFTGIFSQKAVVAPIAVTENHQEKSEKIMAMQLANLAQVFIEKELYNSDGLSDQGSNTLLTNAFKTKFLEKCKTKEIPTVDDIKNIIIELENENEKNLIKEKINIDTLLLDVIKQFTNDYLYKTANITPEQNEIGDTLTKIGIMAHALKKHPDPLAILKNLFSLAMRKHKNLSDQMSESGSFKRKIALHPTLELLTSIIEATEQPLKK